MRFNGYFGRLKTKLAVGAIAAAMMAMASCWSDPAWAGRVVNSQGTSGACVSVTSATVKQVIPAVGDSCVTWATSQSVMCNWGDALGDAASPAPTATVGWLQTSSMAPFHECGLGAKLRLDCIAVSTTANVCTVEDQ